jgi:hypothetical protein
MIIGTHLDKVQLILGDGQPGSDGSIWSRAELLEWFLDGYRHLLAESQATRRLTVLDVPPRVPWALTHPWQRALIGDDAAEVWAFQGQGGWAASHLWQLEVLWGLASTAAGEPTVTHPWQRTFANPVHQHFRFVLPRDSGRIVKLWYDHALLIPVATRRLDALETDWYSLDGDPVAWTRGIGPNRTVEVYEIETAYEANYRFVDGDTREGNPRHGIARYFTGDRTYSWVSVDGDTIPYGLVRRITSPDRQYWPRLDTSLSVPTGRAGWFASSAAALLVLEVRVPEIEGLTPQDEPALLPAQMGKYLRYYTLARAFGRQGEGFNPSLSAFFAQWYNRGIALMRILHQVARKDRQVARDPQGYTRRRPPRVRLPADYPAVLPP